MYFLRVLGREGLCSPRGGLRSGWLANWLEDVHDRKYDHRLHCLLFVSFNFHLSAKVWSPVLHRSTRCWSAS